MNFLVEWNHWVRIWIPIAQKPASLINHQIWKQHSQTIQNIKTNPTRQLFVQHFLSVCQNRNSSQRTGFHWTSEIKPARNPFSSPDGCGRPRTPKQYHVCPPLCWALRPPHLQALWKYQGHLLSPEDPKATHHIWLSSWAAGNLWELSLCQGPRVLKPWGTLLWLPLEWIANKCESLGIWESGDKASRFNAFKRSHFKAQAEGL